MAIKKRIIICLVLLFCVTSNYYSQNVKLAQTGMKFLSIAGDARSAGFADAVTSLEGNSAFLLYNPASVARQNTMLDFTFGKTNWIADIKYINSSVTFAPSQASYGVFGLSLISVDYGEFNRTIIGPDGGALDIGTYSPTALAVGISYAKALSEKFAVGGSIRYVYQNFGNGHIVGGDYENFQTQKIDLDVMAFDFGIIYKTGFKSLNLGMSIRNFSEKIKYVDESFQLPLNFKLGLSMNIFDFLSMDPLEHTFSIAVDAEHPRDNKEMLHLGIEYTFMNTLVLRSGYITPRTTEAGIHAGVGIQYEIEGINFGVDYSFTEFNLFQNVHRISIKVSY